MSSVIAKMPKSPEPKTEETCCSIVWRGDHYHQCQNRGYLKYAGLLYCKQHHPPTIAAKDKARWAAEEAAEIAEKKAQSELIRKASSYDRLLQWLDERSDGQCRVSEIRKMLKSNK